MWRPSGVSTLGPMHHLQHVHQKPLERIIHRHDVQYHKYADDLQLYGRLEQTSLTARLRSQLDVCLLDIRTRMLKHLLYNTIQYNTIQYNTIQY